MLSNPVNGSIIGLNNKTMKLFLITIYNKPGDMLQYDVIVLG